MPQSGQTHFKNLAAFAAKYKWDKVSKNGSSEICGRQSLKKLKWYHITSNFFKGCLPQIWLGPFLNILPLKPPILDK